MKPVLFSPTETSFSTNGIGILSDAISCRPIQELNGRYELELKYPITGLHFSSIQQRNLILAKVDPVSELQPFRVYQITKPSSGIVTVRARHLAYDLGGIPVSPFAAQSAPLALNGLSANAVTDCPFTFSTDKSTAAAFAVAVPSAIWSLLGGSQGGILDTYGGEYEFDKYNVKLWNRRGTDRGVSIRYGKNLTSLEQDENCANCFTGVYPYWTNTDGQLVQLPERVVNAPGTHSYSKVMPLDLSTEWQEAPTEDQLRARTEQYIADNDIGKPAVSWKVEFVQLEQTEEYKGKALLERVLLGDTVSVDFEQMGVSASARVVAVDYDSVLERYNSVTLGSVKANISNTIAQQNKDIAAKPGKSEMQIAIEQLTNTILGAAGGSVRMLDTDGDKVPDTLYIADNPDPEQAIKVWRFNYEGWAASENGYNGPFVMGATLEDGFLAEFIKAGVLSSADGKIVINLNGGESGPIFNTGISANGYVLRGDSIGSSRLFDAGVVTQDGHESISMRFFTASGHGVGAITNIFDSNKNVVGLQYRLFSLKPNGDRTNCIDISTGPDGDARMSLNNRNGEFVGGMYLSTGTDNPESTLSVDNAFFNKLKGKELSWKYSTELGCNVLCGE